MKPIEQMTEEELTDLLFYEHSTGTKIALSKINAIKPNSVDIEGYPAPVTISPEVYTIIVNKLLRYETYKLSNVRENLLKVQEQQLADTFKSSFENVVNSLVSRLSYLDTIEDTANISITKFNSTLAEAIGTVRDSSKTFNREVNNLNLDSIHNQIKSKLKTFSDYLDNLETPVVELDKMSKLLKEIFTEDIIDKREP